MTPPPSSRRDFTWQASLGLCGWLYMPFPLLSADGGTVPDGDPAAKRLILLGLNALARAHEMSYFTDGHRGAGLVAAHLFCEDNQLPDALRLRIERLVDLSWAKSALCRPFPEEDPDPAGVKKIGDALVEAGDSLREVGHNSIFAALAIKAFHILPEAATPARIEGVCRLIRAIQPWRDHVKPAEDVDPPSFADSAAVSAFILREASAAVDRWTDYGQGFSGHMLTFGHSLVELAAMGKADLAESCRTAFRKYVTITRAGPQPQDKKFAEHKRSKMGPKDIAYWHQRTEKQLGIGHVFKYPYSYFDLQRRANDPALAQEWAGKEYRVL